MQRTSIARAAKARGDEIGTWYTERVSAQHLQRPELDRLRADARAGHVRKLYVWRLDRLARSGIRDTLQLLEELRHHGCEVVSISDGFDLSGPAADVVLAVLAWAAKMELVAIHERLDAARERARVEGRAWGRPKRMIAADVAKARAMQASGKSLREIAVALKVPRPTVARALSPPSQNPPPPPRAKTLGKSVGKRGAAR